jgi:hypothetical protein
LVQDIISDGQASIHQGGSLDPFGIPLEPGQPYEGRESVLLFGKNINTSQYPIEALNGLFYKKRIFETSALIPGYYQVPEYSTIKLSPAVTQLQLTSGSQSGLTFRNPPSRVISPFFQAMPPPGSYSPFLILSLQLFSNFIIFYFEEFYLISYILIAILYLTGFDNELLLYSQTVEIAFTLHCFN